MPTVITKTVGSAGGRDYATIALAIAALPASLVTADEQWVFELFNDSEFTDTSTIATISGASHATDATRDIIFKCGSGQSFDENAGKLTNALLYNQTNGVGIRVTGGSAFVFDISDANVTLDGLQIFQQASGGFAAIKQRDSTSTHPLIIKNCIIEASGTNDVVINPDSLEMANTLVVQVANDSSAHGVVWTQNGLPFHIYASSVVCAIPGSTAHGIAGGFSLAQVVDTVVMGFGTAFTSSYDATTDFNASDDATAPGSSSLINQTYADQFQDVAGDFRVKAGATLISAGTPASSQTNDLDIVGQDRSLTTPTIGAWEYHAASTATAGRGRSVL